MRRLVPSLVVLVALAAGARGEWEGNTCVQCHQREVLPVTLGHTFADWRASIHARDGVGCEKCHGGDATADDEAQAHRGVRPATEPESSVHPKRLPATCGSCHKKELEAFNGTVHAQQLAEKGTGATCFTCHEAMATSLPTPREMSARCGVCHDRPMQVQTALTMIAMTKTKLWRTRKALDIARTANPTWHDQAIGRFHDLEREYRDIQLKWHTFRTAEVLDDTRDLVKLADAIAKEADVMIRRGSK
jgi:hypothetical protein